MLSELTLSDEKEEHKNIDENLPRVIGVKF